MKRFFSISAVLIGLVLCLVSCENSSNSLKGSKWQTYDGGSEVVTVKFTSETAFIIEWTYNGKLQVSGVGTNTMVSATELTGSIIFDEGYYSVRYTGILDGNNLTISSSGMVYKFKRI